MILAFGIACLFILEYKLVTYWYEQTPQHQALLQIERDLDNLIKKLG
jgi:hypothetical protein